VLSWVYVGADEINFVNKIEGNYILAMEIEEGKG
jgi:hypothetical protein